MDLTLSLTHRCNLGCRYCYAGTKRAAVMPWSVATAALELAFTSPAKLVRVLFFGGEPLLEPALIEAVVLEAKRRAETCGKALRFGLTTNGTLLDDARLELLQQHRFLTAVSLDGDEAAHDAGRRYADGRSSYADVRAGIERALARGLAVPVVAVLHRGNLNRLASSFDSLLELGIRRMAFNLDYDTSWSDEDLEALDAAYASLACRVLARYREGIDFTVQPFHAKIVSRLKAGFSACDRCDFGVDELAVAPSGRLYPCDRLIGEDGPAQADMVIGDVYRGVDRSRRDALIAAKNRAREECRDCALVDRCMWWCGCVNRALTGRVDGESGFLCGLEQRVVAHADAVASALFAEQCPAFLKRYYLSVCGGGHGVMG